MLFVDIVKVMRVVLEMFDVVVVVELLMVEEEFVVFVFLMVVISMLFSSSWVDVGVLLLVFRFMKILMWFFVLM